MSTRAQNFLFVLVITVTWLLAVQLTFLHYQSSLSAQTDSMVRSQIEFSVSSLTYDNLVRSLQNLENRNLVSCLEASVKTSDQTEWRKVYRSSDPSSCELSALGLDGTQSEYAVDLASNKSWQVSYLIRNGPQFFLLLWILRIGGAIILSISYLLFKAAQQRKNMKLLARVQEAEIAAKIARQVSHDIRSPLSALAIVSARVNQIPAVEREMIQASARRIQQIADELLNQHKVETERSAQASKPGESEYSLSACLNLIMSEKKAEYQNAKIEFQSDIPEDLKVRTRLSEIDLGRIISNIINNSVAASAPSGVIRLHARAQGKQIAVTVQDYGKGMAPEMVKTVMNGGTILSTTGHGLGLSHAHETLSLAGVGFQIISKPNAGCLVQITFQK